jgi:hypothetical protein
MVEYLYDKENGGLLHKNGRKAGSPNSKGHVQVEKNGKKTMVHRIVFEMHKGAVPKGKVVDHKDGNPANNKISNLRAASVAENRINTLPNKGAKTGAKGVTATKSGKYRARVCEGGVNKTVGTFATVEAAANAAKKARKKIFGNFVR